MAKDQLFYIGQKALIKKDDEILVLNDPEFGLDLPGGKIQEGEVNFEKSLKREVKEETGIEIEVGDLFFKAFFEFPKKSKHRHRGKKIFVVFYNALYVSGSIMLSEEHDGYKWINKNTYKKLKYSELTSINIKALRKYFENL